MGEVIVIHQLVIAFFYILITYFNPSGHLTGMSCYQLLHKNVTWLKSHFWSTEPGIFVMIVIIPNEILHFQYTQIFVRLPQTDNIIWNFYDNYYGPFKPNKVSSSLNRRTYNWLKISYFLSICFWTIFKGSFISNMKVVQCDGQTIFQ